MRAATSLRLVACVACLGAQQVVLAQGTPRLNLPTQHASFEESLSDISHLVELRDGSVLLHDAREQLLLLLDERSGLRRVVAAVGSGPLEYRSVAALLRVPGDSVALWDGLQNRILWITPDARPRGTTLLVGADGTPSIWGNALPREVDATGRWYALYRGSVLTGAMSAQFADSLALVRLSASRARLDTLARLGIVPAVRARENEDETAITIRSRGFTAVHAWGVFPNGRVLLLPSDSYAPILIDPTGRRTTAPVVDSVRVPVTAALRSFHVDSMRRAWLQRFASRAAAEGFESLAVSVLAPERWQTHLPPVSGSRIRVDARGRAWVRVPNGSDIRLERYDLLDADGRRVASVQFPLGLRLVGFGARGLYAALEDEDGLLSLRRYALP